VLPICCLEKHGDHLPLGTDMAIARTVTEKAEDICSVKFSEVKHYAGTVALNGDMQMKLQDAVVKAIRRNGSTKLSSPETMSSTRTTCGSCPPIRCKSWTAVSKRPDYGHADLIETSEILHLDPALVHMDKLNSGEWDRPARADG